MPVSGCKIRGVSLGQAPGREGFARAKEVSKEGLERLQQEPAGDGRAGGKWGTAQGEP